MTRDEAMKGLRERGWYRENGSHAVYLHPEGGRFELDRFDGDSVQWQMLGEIWPDTAGNNRLGEAAPLPFQHPALPRLQAAKRALNEHHCEKAMACIEEAIGLL